ncbi:acyl-homoserine-lactone synthase [Sphingosinicella sp. LHD-64]|uniref:acyl-homoserine-lactone synthase n=1 Tax=Sphingosinicella sp. LHD-64 TaxID=3072139 RepID=UPI00280F0CF6|nr:acyl-homoserine-lactone synthase [Sphingosinicella sp. LHD-64]MDQ8757461.1 acyl-homoserine-lactone synthase [Sphingosinicella sp. LHD-64]
MILTVPSGSRAAAAPVLRAMFAARKQVFVDLLGWDLPVLAGRYEIDQFDDAHARYLIVADAAHRHLGSARLLPTMRPHILDTLFAELCEDAPPRGEDIYEISRFCLGRSLGATRRREVRDALVTALVDDALANQVTAYTGVAEMGWLQQILAFGWRCRPLGLPRPVDGTMLGALRIDITPDTPARLARAGIGAPDAARRMAA